MDLIDLLLGRSDRYERVPGLLGRLSHWLVSCSCLLTALVLLGVVLVLGGFISLGESAVTVVIVFVTIVVAIASLIRTSLGY
ncbi:MAG: hypothetical protein AB1435_14950 [Chloroflexota bacterium]